MGKLETIFVGLFLGTYAISNCPEFGFDHFLTRCGFVGMAALVVLMLTVRLQYAAAAFIPTAEKKKTAAIFVAGCDQCLGWQVASRFMAYEMRVYAAFEDPTSDAADWLRRHGVYSVTTVQLRPGNVEDVAAAARIVEQTLGDRELIAVVDARHPALKLMKTLEIQDESKGVHVDSTKLSEAFTPLLSKYKGRFILVADMAGRFALPSLLPYCISQALTLQNANNIRKTMKKSSVPVHVVEVLLYHYHKTLEDIFYPRVDPDDGKVNVKSRADRVDHWLFLVTQTVFKACLTEKPKERYLTSIGDYFMDKIIRYSPSSVHEKVINHYMKFLGCGNWWE